MAEVADLKNEKNALTEKAKALEKKLDEYGVNKAEKEITALRGKL